MWHFSITEVKVFSVAAGTDQLILLFHGWSIFLETKLVCSKVLGLHQNPDNTDGCYTVEQSLLAVSQTYVNLV